jgi:glycerol-3-phosphate acyltransferase PlsY
VGSIGACLALGLLATLGYCKPGFVLPGAVDVYTLALSWVIAVFVIYKHKANMVRLWNGTENGFGKKRR